MKLHMHAPEPQGISIPCDTNKKLPMLWLGLVCLAFSILHAQSQTGTQEAGVVQAQAGVQEPSRTARASRVDSAPKMDGTLNDPLWMKATPITNFLQREPFEGQPPTERTE